MYCKGLTSERLVMRELTKQDSKEWAYFMAHPEASKFLFADPLLNADESAKHWINKQLNRYAENRYGHHALIHKRTGAFIGQCGLLLQEVDGNTEIEIGYHLFPAYWGQGYASEAAKTFKNFAFTNNLSDSLISIVYKDNMRSQKVAWRNGMIMEKETIHSDELHFVFRIEKHEWEDNAS